MHAYTCLPGCQTLFTVFPLRCQLDAPPLRECLCADPVHVSADLHHADCTYNHLCQINSSWLLLGPAYAATLLHHAWPEATDV